MILSIYYYAHNWVLFHFQLIIAKLPSSPNSAAYVIAFEIQNQQCSSSNRVVPTFSIPISPIIWNMAVLESVKSALSISRKKYKQTEGNICDDLVHLIAPIARGGWLKSATNSCLSFWINDFIISITFSSIASLRALFPDHFLTTISCRRYFVHMHCSSSS